MFAENIEHEVLRASLTWQNSTHKHSHTKYYIKNNAGCNFLHNHMLD